jgi:hypothetical protein
MDMGINQKDTDIVLVFDEVLDRRAFDLFNLYRLKGLGYRFAFAEKSWAQQCLYPGSISYKKTPDGLTELFRVHPDARFIYIPLLEESLVDFYKWDPIVKEKLLFILPTQEQFEMLIDKKALTYWAQQWNWAPATYSYESLCDEKTWTNGLKVMAKPVYGRGSRGIKVLHNSEDACAFSPNEPYLYQTFVGDGKSVVGVSVLSNHGEIVSLYQHQRIRTYPESGGVSTHAELCYEARLTAILEKMVTTLNCSGLLMFEFLCDADGNWLLLECNPRLWGTVALGEFSGYSLVQKYIALCTGTDFISEEINTDSRIRWMFPYEYMWVLKGGFKRLKWFSKQPNEWQIGMSGAGVRFFGYVYFSLFDLKKWKTFWRKLMQS